jgi:hypothetical protein
MPQHCQNGIIKNLGFLNIVGTEHDMAEHLGFPVFKLFRNAESNLAAFGSLSVNGMISEFRKQQAC